MVDPVSLTVSVLALAVSATTAWLTLFRRGTVRMTPPTVIYFGPDAPRPGRATQLPKVYLRTLLFATSKRGRIVESMHVELHCNETHQSFNIWVHGDQKLVRGSGLYVGETGIGAEHHFLTPDDDNNFQYVAGKYRLEVFAHLLGDEQSKLLFSQDLEITTEIADALKKKQAGVYFDRGARSKAYIPHLDSREALDAVAIRALATHLSGGQGSQPEKSV
ncbi:hypothetical protein OVY01_22560 [Robbsia sp. Bb-Pol-6]|uniref:Uncharacterized protein n=1 Tax=Robbsia betulipollinis TaxID=2981849 RepID=A0ABT3ZUM5_9BURK|nr:hypothetical protein [Robbsia betulipollinis]MCY0389925.1 hypothetical protein [Robbsia betulipollinis]